MSAFGSTGRVIRAGLGFPLPWWFFVLILSVPYVWFGSVLGATFWIDGFNYAGLASTLGDAAAYQEFNSGYGRLALSHLQIGLPSLGWALNRLPVGWQWPILEIFQRMISLGSLVLALGALTVGRPRVVHLLAGSLIAWSPFLQAFHNAFMTESLSGSLLLCGFGLGVLLFRNPLSSFWLLLATAATIFLATQFRSYYGALIFSMAAAGLWLGRPSRKVAASVVLAVAAIAAVLFYPACRWLATGDWFLPGVGVNRLIVATYLNGSPGDAVRNKIETFSAAEREVLRPILTPNAPFGAENARKLALLMLKSGMSEREVDAKLKDLGDTILTENPEFLAKRVRHGLASSAMVDTSCVAMDGVEMFRGLSPERYHQHLGDVFRWHSWLSPEDYRASFASFFDTPRDIYPATAPGQKWMRDTEQGYVRLPSAMALRDPLGVGRIPPDAWAWAGLLSALVLLARRNIAGVLVLGACLANFLVGFAVPVGNPRYAYGVFALYPLAICALTLVCLRLPDGESLRFSFRTFFGNVLKIFHRSPA
ncbi:MAG TPA: hypothetical protein VIM61_06290 [Chthoniobacterales bacterium]|jgi:hypothetical protein